MTKTIFRPEEKDKTGQPPDKSDITWVTFEDQTGPSTISTSVPPAPAQNKATQNPTSSSSGGILSALPSSLNKPSPAQGGVADSFNKDAGAVLGGRVIESAIFTEFSVPRSIDANEFVQSSEFKATLQVAMARTLNVATETVGIAWVLLLDVKKNNSRLLLQDEEQDELVYWDHGRTG